MLRALVTTLLAIGLAGTATTPWRDPDVMCWRPECEANPPGPMPVVHARLGEPVTFHCYAYAPCAEVILELDEPISRLRVTLSSGLDGGYGANAVPPPGSGFPGGPDTFYGTGYAFGIGGPFTFDHEIPFQTTDWRLTFGPTSGAHGDDVTLVVEAVS